MNYSKSLLECMIEANDELTQDATMSIAKQLLQTMDMNERLLKTLKDCLSLLESEYPECQWATDYKPIIEAQRLIAEIEGEIK